MLLENSRPHSYGAQNRIPGRKCDKLVKLKVDSPLIVGDSWPTHFFCLPVLWEKEPCRTASIIVDIRPDRLWRGCLWADTGARSM